MKKLLDKNYKIIIIFEKYKKKPNYVVLLGLKGK